MNSNSMDETNEKKTHLKNRTYIWPMLLCTGVDRARQAQHRICTAIMIHHKIVINMNMRTANAIYNGRTQTREKKNIDATKPRPMRMQHSMAKQLVDSDSEREKKII